MGCSRNTGPDCSRELVEAVAKQLATRTVRDSDISLVDSIDEDNTVVIVQDGQNKRISLETLSNALYIWLAIDDIKDGLSVHYNTTEYWNNAIGYIPGEGAMIVYSDYQTVTAGGQEINIPGIKIGSGNAYVQDLAFVGSYEAAQLLSHISNTDIHVSSEQKAAWDRKLNIDDDNEVVDETLIFIRN